MRLGGSGTATALLAAGLMGGMGSWPSCLCLSTVFAHSPAAKISDVDMPAYQSSPGCLGSAIFASVKILLNVSAGDRLT
jgi:hypothetical protein